MFEMELVEKEKKKFNIIFCFIQLNLRMDEIRVKLVKFYCDIKKTIAMMAWNVNISELQSIQRFSFPLTKHYPVMKTYHARKMINFETISPFPFPVL